MSSGLSFTYVVNFFEIQNIILTLQIAQRKNKKLESTKIAKKNYDAAIELFLAEFRAMDHLIKAHEEGSDLHDISDEEWVHVGHFRLEQVL